MSFSLQLVIFGETFDSSQHSFEKINEIRLSHFQSQFYEVRKILNHFSLYKVFAGKKSNLHKTFLRIMFLVNDVAHN